MSGPAPKPTALRAVEGNRGKRPFNKQEPDPAYLEDLSAPEWLPPEAKAVWDNLAPQLKKAQLLCEIDVDLLAMTCVHVAQYRQAVRMAGARLVIAQKADPILGAADDADRSDDERAAAEAESSKGACLNPWLIVQSMSFKAAMKGMSEFGMSPSARTRLAIQPQGDLFGSENPNRRYFGAS